MNIIKVAKQRHTIGELKAYDHHSKNLNTVTKKVDDNPVRLSVGQYINTGKHAEDVKRLKEIDDQNRMLMQHINVIYRTTGKVDCSSPNVAYFSNFADRQLTNKKLERENAKLYDLIQSSMPKYSTKEYLNNFKKIEQIMIFMSKYPEFYETSLPLLERWTICPLNLEKPICCPTRRVRCYFDIEAHNPRKDDVIKLGRMIIEVYRDYVPYTGDNFVRLCRGDNGLTYKGSTFHRIVTDLICMGGDIERGTGTGGISAYYKDFPDENYLLKFAGPGVISTYTTTRPGRNNSQFLITFRALEALNGKFVVFGRVIQSISTLLLMNEFGTKVGKPTQKIIIADCGILGPEAEKNYKPTEYLEMIPQLSSQKTESLVSSASQHKAFKMLSKLLESKRSYLLEKDLPKINRLVHG